MRTEPNFHESIAGKQLSAITFVMDYWQLQFDGVIMNALTRVQVSADGKAVANGDDQFRNVICGQIGKIVATVAFEKSQSFTITFEDRTSISISLKTEDYVGPEAIVLNDSNQTIVVRDGDVCVFPR
jgi:hypothetical protein